MEWDEVASKDIADELFLCLCPYLKMEEVLFTRRVAYMNADSIVLMLYFDGSNTAIAVSMYVKDIFGVVLYA